MSDRTPRGTYPGTRKFQRPHLRRFDPGLAANDPVAPDGPAPRAGEDGLDRRTR